MAASLRVAKDDLLALEQLHHHLSEQEYRLLRAKILGLDADQLNAYYETPRTPAAAAAPASPAAHHASPALDTSLHLSRTGGDLATTRVASPDRFVEPASRTTTYTRHRSAEGRTYFTRTPSPYGRDHPESYHAPPTPGSRSIDASRRVSVSPVRRMSGSFVGTQAGIIDNEWLDVTLNTLRLKLEQKYVTMMNAFRALDGQKAGFIENIDLARKLEVFNLGLSAQQQQILVETLDANKDGFVTFHDFLSIMEA